jgi:DNA-binding NarL/FixJ family response regulator
MPGGQRVKLVLADSHRLVIESLATALIQRGIGVAALATSPPEVLAQVAEHQPDICLLTTHFPWSSGLDVLRVIRKQHPHVKVVMLSAAPDPSLMAAAIEGGAAGIISKYCHIVDVVRALPRLRQGERVFDGASLGGVVGAFHRPAAGHSDRHRVGLTRREQEVLTQIVEGKSTRQIARSLSVTDATVRMHVRNVLVKLGVHSRLEASTLGSRVGHDRHLPRWHSSPGRDRPQMPGASVRRSRTVPPGRGRNTHDRTILVVDDHVIFAEAVASAVDNVPGLHAFAAITIEEARRALAEREVDAVLLEIGLNGNGGMRFARQTIAENPGLPVVAVTAVEDEAVLVDTVRAGVSGWVPKDESLKHLVSVVHSVLRGETWIPPRLLTRVLAELTSAHGNAANHDVSLVTLTRREREVLDLLMRGMKTDHIAQQLCMSKSTLRTHIQHILRKLNVHSTLAAVALVRGA